MIFLFWILFSVGVGYLAKQNGRNPALWGVIALVISPILGLIILMLAESGVISSGNQGAEPRTDTKARPGTNERDRKRDVEPLSVSDFSEKLDKYKDLLDTDMINEKEYKKEKNSLIKRLSYGFDGDSKEDILLKIREMRDRGVITKRDVNKIKSDIL